MLINSHSVWPYVFTLFSAYGGVCVGEEGQVGSRAVAARQSFPSDAEIRALLKDIIPVPEIHGVVVGLIEPDGRRRVVAHGSVRQNGGALDAESVFEIGSVSKAFVGAVLADMVLRGEVELRQPIARLLPSKTRVPSRNGNEITLLDLATHTSGLPRMPGNFPRTDDPEAHAGYTMERIYEFLENYELPRDPGAGYEYSNVITLLGQALALRAGKSYESLLRERVLLPLDMEHTAVTLTAAMESRLTTATNRAGERRPHFAIPAFIASGGLKSTMNDMLDFAAANLSADTAAVFAALRDSRRPYRPLGDSGEFMGLGWATDKEGRAGLSGATYGYRSYLYVDPVRRLAVVVLMNYSEGDATALGLRLRETATQRRPGK